MYGALVVSGDSELLSQAKRFITNINNSIMVETLNDPSKIRDALRSTALIDVVVCDHNLPSVDALSVFNEMNRMNDMRPFIIMTSKADGDVAIKAFELRMDYYLSRENIMNFYMELASKIVLCAERKKLEDDRALNEKRMQALMNLLMMHDKEFGDILNYALEESVALTKSTIGYIAMYEEDTRKLKMAAWSRGGLDQCRMENRQITYDFDSSGMWGEPIRQGRPIIVNDYPKEISYGKMDLPHGHVQLNRIMMIPIFHNGKILATAGIGNKAREYTSEDLMQFTLLMDGLMSIYHERMLEGESARSEHNLQGILQNAPVGIIIVDEDMFMIDSNDYAKSMLSLHSLCLSKEPLRSNQGELSRIIKKDIEKVRESGHGMEFEHTIEKDNRNFVLKVNVAKTQGKNKEETGFIVIIDDISELSTVSRQQIVAMERINLLDRLINDDIRGHLTNMKIELDVAPEGSPINNVRKDVEDLDEIMTFVKEYHDVGMLEPQWQSLDEVLDRAIKVNGLDRDSVRYSVRGVRILADPAFVNVFSQLMEYSILQNGRGIKCSIKCMLEEKDLTITYSDNGKGIPYDDKDDFVSGTNMNFGRGIYLAFSILKACGFYAKESGIPEKGLMVEIVVPAHKYSITWD